MFENGNKKRNIRIRSCGSVRAGTTDPSVLIMTDNVNIKHSVFRRISTAPVQTKGE